MTELEKVIKGLEICIRVQDNEKCPDECPYRKNICYGTVGLMADALSLLKAQEPRVMTLGEAVEHAKLPQFEWSEKVPVYIEYHIKRPFYVKWLTAEALNIWLNDDRKDDYNRANKFGWRCWTSRPTDEQREATQWAK